MCDLFVKCVMCLVVFTTMTFFGARTFFFYIYRNYFMDIQIKNYTNFLSAVKIYNRNVCFAWH